MRTLKLFVDYEVFKMDCIHCGVSLRSIEQKKCLVCERHPRHPLNSTNERDSDIEIYESAPQHITFESNRHRQISSTSLPNRDKAHTNLPISKDRELYNEAQRSRQKAIGHSVSKKSSSTSQFSINQSVKTIERWIEIWSYEDDSPFLKVPNCLELVSLLPSEEVLDWDDWIWKMAFSIKNWKRYCEKHDYTRDKSRTARVGRMVGRAPGLLRDDTWTHLKNLIDRFQENQHAFFILPIVRVQWESDNSSPPKKVDSKVKIEEIEVKAENRVKKENEKQVNCKASLNDSLNDGFDYLNDLDLDDIERKPTEHAQTDTFDFASDDSELTELDGESIEASVMKTSQSKPRIVL